MIAFQVSVNGKPLCTADIGEFGRLRADIDWESFFTLKDGVVGNLWIEASKTSDDRKAHWAYAPVNVGDEVTIKVTKIDSPDSSMLPTIPAK